MTLIETKSKKVEFGLKAYFKPTPTNLQKWMAALKGFCMAISGAAILTESPYLAFSVLVIGALADEFAKLFSETPKP